MLKKILSLLVSTGIIALMLAPPSFAWPGKGKFQLPYPTQTQVQTQTQTGQAAEDPSPADGTDVNVNNGKHKGIAIALTHVKNPLARAVLQAIQNGQSVCDAVYNFKNQLGSNVQPDDVETVVGEVYDNISGNTAVNKKVKALTYKYMAQIQLKVGRNSDALKMAKLSALNNCNDSETYQELDRLYAKNNDLNVKVYINGKNPVFDVNPTIVNGRTLVPVRFIAEGLNAGISYDESTDTVTIEGVQTVIKLKINSKTAYVNGQPVSLDVPATIENGRTIVPLRFISEGFKCKVNYYGESNLVSITS